MPAGALAGARAPAVAPSADSRNAEVAAAIAAQFAEEEHALQTARQGHGIRIRYMIAALGFLVALADLAADFFRTSTLALLVPPAVTVAINLLAHAAHRGERFAPWQLRVALLFDAFIIAAMAALVGEASYLAIPFYVVVAANNALGMPGAARATVAIAAVCYPLARVVGVRLAGLPVNGGLVALETVLLLFLCHLAIRGPSAYTVRLHRTRRALAAVERGDFTVRLPTRGRDDIGFLAVSFNATVEAVGGMVRELQGQAAALTTLSAEVAAGSGATTSGSSP